jgi:hypothetical protein
MLVTRAATACIDHPCINHCINHYINHQACTKWAVLGAMDSNGNLVMSKYCPQHVKADALREATTTLEAIEIEKVG